MKNPLAILQSQFGYSSFRLEQEAIINAVLQKKDTFVLMPTGGGKSVCYQIPALIFDGLTVVISPLIALMKDQVDALRLNGVQAAYLNSTQSYQEQDIIIAKAKSGELKLLYLAPESAFLKKITSFRVSLLAIDEAHCISHWGHDFRPEYLMLAQVKRSLPGVPVIALTATADKLTRKDIVEKLELNQPQVFISSFNRSNIRYTVEPKQRNFEKLLEFLERRRDESGIIYCLSRASTEALAEDLSDEGFNALAYHAGMDKTQRAHHQEMFLRDEVKIMVATIAFGMGIDKSNVRYVVHMDLPKNIESYYQETGRAGRDGLNSEALLFYSYGDVAKLKHFAKIEGNEEQTEIAFRKLDQMASYGGLRTCRRKFLLNYFDEETLNYCGNCDVCLTKYEVVDGTALALKLLTAVGDVQERFGASYIIDFLRGSNSSKIQEAHRQLKTFGTGNTTSRDEWTTIVNDLVSQGYLAKAEGMFPILKYTARSQSVLNGEQKVLLTKSKEKIQAAEQAVAYESALFSKLKELRLKLAMQENVPAYIVLSDATLIELATYLPLQKEDFAKISGFGNVKLEKYGKQFWQVVSDYCNENKLHSRIHLKVAKHIRKEKRDVDSGTKRQSFDLFHLGHSIEEIAEIRRFAVSTIENHLTFYVESGLLDINQIVKPEKIAAIQKALEHSDGLLLSPVKNVLGDTISYGEIRMVMAHLKFSKAAEPELQEGG
jgi:ATP-dependent DNA helicase RecQ